MFIVAKVLGRVLIKMSVAGTDDTTELCSQEYRCTGSFNPCFVSYEVALESINRDRDAMEYHRRK